MTSLKRGAFLLFIVAFYLTIFMAYVVTSKNDTFTMQWRPLMQPSEYSDYPFVLCRNYLGNEISNCWDSKPHNCYNPWNGSTHSTFTMIIQTYNRTDILPKVLAHYCAMGPPLGLVIVVWNNANVSPPNGLWPDSCPVKVLTQKQNKMRNRLQHFSEIEGKAILMMDDDILMPLSDVLFAFRVWQQFPQLIVGFYPRKHVKVDGHYVYGTREADSGTQFHKNAYSMILIGAAFFHSEYLKMFNDKTLVPLMVHDMIDSFENCDDIAMNVMVAHFLAKAAFPQCPGLYIRSQNRQIIENETKGNPGKWHNPSHKLTRSSCLNMLSDLYGGLPLLYSDIMLTPMS